MKRASGAVLLAAMAVAAAGCAGSQPRSVKGAPAPPSAAEMRTLARLALSAAKGAGDVHPTGAMVVPTTRKIAEQVDAGSGVGYANTPAYFVLLRGHFTATGPLPPGAKPPTGTVLTLTIDSTTNRSTDYGIERKTPDLNAIGTPEALPLMGAGRQHQRPLRYRPENLTLYAARPGYRPPVSRVEVLDFYGRRLVPGPKLTSKATVQLRLVNGRNPSPGARGYPAWVLTFHHTKPISYGPASGPQPAVCDWVAIFDLRTRVWTEDFQNCPSRPEAKSSCDSGCTPANQPALDAAAGYAESIAGAAHVYTGVVVDDRANHVIVYLARAPQSILDELRARHPGIYVIHNDAPRTLSAVRQLQNSLDWKALKAQSVDVVSSGPTQDGYLRVGVSSNVAKAQAFFDAKYGRGVVRVVHGEPAIALSARG